MRKIICLGLVMMMGILFVGCDDNTEVTTKSSEPVIIIKK